MKTENKKKKQKKNGPGIRIIFLDIDGVLNSRESITRKKDTHGIYCDLPDMEHIKHLNKIIDDTDARVVISSCWRHSHTVFGLATILYLCGMRPNVVLDVTPRVRLSRSRGEEISKWLEDTHYNIKGIVILDDDRDMNGLLHKLVKIEGQIGLTYEDAEKAIKIIRSSCE